MIGAWALAAISALAEGLAVGAGLAALVVVLAIGVRLAAASGTLRYAGAYQWALVAGAAVGAADQAWPIRLHGGALLATALGFGMGLFVGMVAAALAETASALPVGARRLGLLPYLPRLVVAVALGKALGAVAWVTVPAFFARPPM